MKRRVRHVIDHTGHFMATIDAIDPGQTLTAEEAMLLLCARTRMSESLLDQVYALAPRVDWERFRQLALQQGVASLAYRNLKRDLANAVPEEVLSQLRRHAIDNTQSNLGLIKEMVSVSLQLQAHDIDYAVFKGITVSQLVYRDFSIRKCGDIDLLVRKRDFQRARDLFLAEGFVPTLTDEEEADCLQSGLWHEQRRLQIDLHWGMSPTMLGIRADRIMDRRAEMPIGGTSVDVFSTEDVFISLCVNAVKEYWNQMLYPYCDIHEFLQSDIALNWQSVLERAKALNGRRPLEAALGVVRCLFENTLPPELERRLDPHSPAGRVSAELLRQLFEKDWSGSNIIHQETGRHLHYFRSTDEYFIALMDQPMRRFGARHLKSFRPRAADRALIKLPDALGFLYYLIRPVRAVGRQARRLTCRLLGKSPA